MVACDNSSQNCDPRWQIRRSILIKKFLFLELNAIALMKANGYTDEQTSCGDDLNGA